MGECLMYGLDLESRCLASVLNEDTVQFLIGTNNIKLDNQICLLTVEDNYARISSQAFVHSAGEIRAIAGSSEDHDMFACSSADYRETTPKFGHSIYKMNRERNQLDTLASTTSEFCPKSFEWESQTNTGSALTSKDLTLFDMNQDLKVIRKQPLNDTVNAQAWSPHNGGRDLGIAMNSDVLYYDCRDLERPSFTIENAHVHRVLHLDFNPNLQYGIATCGDDAAVRIWDSRKLQKPLIVLRPHAHWIWQVRYHPVHDQILLTSGSDACVVLNCVQSVSSEADSQNTEEGTERLEDGVLETIEEHEESVYSCTWSHGDAWTFASLSHDGRVVVSRVKREHKYALMQW
ncbi:unnamed protein product [Auanema sp. JU1783]|nr:unnamed protein product [Auanema sp. JU1783]